MNLCSDAGTQGEIPRWDILNEKEALDCRVFKILSRHEKNRVTGQEGTFSLIKCFDWVVVLARREDGLYAMVEQFRFGTHELSLEFPAGCIDAGEAPLAAAERELREESGCTPTMPGIILGKVFPNPALQDNVCWFVFYDRVQTGGAVEWDPFEHLHLSFRPLAEIRQLAAKGEIGHALVHTALFLLEEHQRAQ
jgi:8-oxo-dGTP pyrophosphatase MutT (NUDIX family)